VSPEVGRCATLLAELLATGIDGDDGPFADARRRFQQLAVAVMAKGSEDTALFDPGVGLCGVEVGGCPDAPAVSPEEFHAAMDARRARPLGLNATSTHDTKRSEDVRARLAVLSEQPSAWLVVLDRWRRSHASVRGSCGTAEEIYLYETIVGVAEPGRATSAGFRRRITEHMVKAAREAKRRTSWADPDAAFEGDLRQFVAAVLSPQNAPFHRDLGHLLDRIVDPARASALAMTVLKVAVPGIPDIYQGTEGGVASLTDPDNRRPAPFGALARTLGRPGGLRGSLAVGAVPDPRKLAVTSAVLGARRADPDLFDRGTYVPLATGGDHRERVIAFARTHRHRVAIAVVTRQVGRLAMVEGRVSSRAWGDTSVKLPAALTGRYVDACSGATVELAQITPVASLLARLPVAMLIRATTDR
jgi:(1->4)-alpha-D-glucan 1-alpha-D-glucosylmutase